MQLIKVIGNSPQSDVIISGKFVSDKHALLIEDNGQIFIEDLDSTFGTFVNGGKISKRTKLGKNDRVKIATQLFHWQDYSLAADNQSESNPIFLKDLFLPKGLVTWRDYKFVLILALGAIIVIPFGVPTVLKLGKYYFTRHNTPFRENLDIWPYAKPLILILGLICLYIFLNLTQKMVRGLRKEKS